jgi:hypothetical protein
MKLNLATLALTTLTVANANDNKNLRGRELSATNGFDESLGRCSGAVCGFWGDPHIVTCDGLAYDCQGIGIFTLMDNHMFNVQGNFVDIGSREHVAVRGWGLTHGASITNDVMIEYKPNPDVPVIQLGFGDLENYQEEIPSEDGCEVWTTFNPVDMGGEFDGKRTCESSLEACRARCEANVHCTQFSYWADCGCHLNNDDATHAPSNRGWPKALAGITGSSCGVPKEQDLTLAGSDGEQDKHTLIRNNCPLLMYIGGELVDLSGVPNVPNGVTPLWGTPADDYYVELVNDNDVKVVHKIDDSNYSEMLLHRTGDGPGEMWSCHWDFKMCLPAVQQQQFEDTSVGLFGTPNGNTQDDWMNQAGDTLELQHTGHNRHENTINYCVDNWCVSEGESLMTYHGDTTYADYKCENEEHVDWEEDNNDCVLSADQILYACKDEPPQTRYACQTDCCLGGCGDETISDDLITNDPEDDKPDVVYDYDGDCEEQNIADGTTGSTICPDADIVKLLKTNGDEALPASADIFYDISFGSGTVSFKVNNPFEANAEAYVKHDKKVLNGFLDPKCEAGKLSEAGCADNFAVEVACLDYDDIEPFALVSVYFASVAVDPLGAQATIDVCCEPEEYAPAVGIVEYTFEVKCGCPGANQVA